MANQSDRRPRLLRLIVLDQGRATSQTLGERLGVSSRTVRRDIAALHKLGILIEERFDGDGNKTYWLSQSQLPQIHFLYDEAFALMLCRSAANVFTGTSSLAEIQLLRDSGSDNVVSPAGLVIQVNQRSEASRPRQSLFRPPASMLCGVDQAGGRNKGRSAATACSLKFTRMIESRVTIPANAIILG
ncbi:MAG: helix-turn-helix domain-containing protein [Planctomycetales bacterium]|nr:helix-turn-helix domain-containing protein [Planctomycetales bacterium]